MCVRVCVCALYYIIIVFMYILYIYTERPSTAIKKKNVSDRPTRCTLRIYTYQNGDIVYSIGTISFSYYNKTPFVSVTAAVIGKQFSQSNHPFNSTAIYAGTSWVLTVYTAVKIVLYFLTTDDNNI